MVVLFNFAFIRGDSCILELQMVVLLNFAFSSGCLLYFELRMVVLFNFARKKSYLYFELQIVVPYNFALKQSNFCISDDEWCFFSTSLSDRVFFIFWAANGGSFQLRSQIG